MRIRPRIEELVMAPIAALLVFDVLAVDWFSGGKGDGRSGLDAGLPAWLVLLVAALAVTALIQAAARRSPTGSLAAEVALFFLAPITVLVTALLLAAPGLFGPDGSSPAVGAWVAFGGSLLLAVVNVLALRNPSRGLAPDPPASVSLLDLPGSQGPLGDG